jgi:hypothetical protein
MFRRAGMAVASVGPDDRVALKYINIARDMGSTVQIASGLSSTDRVIDNPPDSIAANDLVRIAASASPARGPGQD